MFDQQDYQNVRGPKGTHAPFPSERKTLMQVDIPGPAGRMVIRKDLRKKYVFVGVVTRGGKRVMPST
jgi:hypothetical protein